MGLPLKPITMICYDRFKIAFVGFKQTDEFFDEELNAYYNSLELLYHILQ